MTTVISTFTTSGSSVSNDDLVITATGAIVTDVGSGVFFQTADGFASIFGSVTTTVTNGAALFTSVDNVTFDIGPGASLISTASGGDGISVGSAATGVDINIAGFVRGVEYGVITVGESADVNILGTGSVVGGSNTGADESDPAGAAVNITGDGSTLSNAGTITALENAINGGFVAVGNAAALISPGLGLDLTTDATLTFDNSGDVFGDVYLAAGDDTLNNSGYILGLVDLGSGEDTYDGRGGAVDGKIDLGTGEDVATGGDKVDNIDGGDNADTILGGDGADLLDGGSGSDLIRGNDGDDNISGGGGTDVIVGGEGNDFATGEGGNDFIQGNGGDDFIFGAGGKDTIQGGSGDDTIDAGGSNDVVFAGKGDDAIVGKDGGDTILGGSGDDSILGSDGKDLLLAGSGTDTAEGGSGNDTVLGQSGDDVLDGNGGKDEIIGGSGDDVIDGGNDMDMLRGGSGSDVFIFSKVSHSATGKDRDVILDFTKGEDFIDLSDIENLDFIGSSAFSGTGPEVRATTTSSGNTVVRIDSDGDGNDDSQILLKDFDTPLAESDFLL